MPLPGYRGGVGEPLLLVHGLGACWQAWQPVLEQLSAHHDVSAPDLPGFGTAAPLAGGDPSPTALADALERHLDDLDWPQARVVGNSLGGLLALELARRGRARSVLAISPAGMARGWEDLLARSLIRSQVHLGRLLRPAVGTLSRSRVARSLTMGAVAARPWLMPAEMAEQLACAYVDSPVVLATLDAFDGAPTTERLDEIDCPVTIAWGSRDRVLLPRQGERFKAALPGARLVRLRGLGHSPMSDDPKLVAELILATRQGDHEAGRPVGSS